MFSWSLQIPGVLMDSKGLVTSCRPLLSRLACSLCRSSLLLGSSQGASQSTTTSTSATWLSIVPTRPLSSEVPVRWVSGASSTFPRARGGRCPSLYDPPSPPSHQSSLVLVSLHLHFPHRDSGDATLSSQLCHLSLPPDFPQPPTTPAQASRASDGLENGDEIRLLGTLRRL